MGSPEAHLFIDRGSYERGGVARPYASKDSWASSLMVEGVGVGG